MHSRTRVIALVNQKGGVGKSTTAVNLGAALAILGHAVLVVDADPQGNTTTGLGIEKSAVVASTYEVLMRHAAIEEAIVPTEIERLRLLPATIDLAGAEVELVSELSRETRLREAVVSVAGGFEYVLVDSPPSLGLLTVNALVAASEAMIPVQAEFYALEGLSQLTRVVERVRGALNPGLHVSGVLVTMYDGRTRLATDVLAELARFFPEEIFKTQIPRNVRLSEAPSFGKPVMIFDPKSRGAQAYMALAREVAQPAGVHA
ncbi:MAG: ParA family protein [Candidatus Tyrphobacter sp.]